MKYRQLAALGGLLLVLSACGSDNGSGGSESDVSSDGTSDTTDVADGGADRAGDLPNEVAPDAADAGEDATQDGAPDLAEDEGEDVAEDEGEDLVEDEGEDVAEDEGTDVVEDEGGDVVEDEGTDVVEDEGGDAATCDGDCPTGTATGNGSQDVIILAVDFVSDRVVLENASGGALTASGWWICQGPGEYAGLPDLVFAADGDRITLDLLDNDTSTATEIFLSLGATFDLAPDDNLGLYRNNSNFASADNIEAYVQWTRGGTPPDGRESVAVTAGVWSVDSPVDVCATFTGIMATGDVTDPANWQDADDPESCR